MHEALRVRERIGRIDALREERAGPRALLAELDRLVDEAREWLAVDQRGADGAAEATLGRLHCAVNDGRKAMIPM